MKTLPILVEGVAADELLELPEEDLEMLAGAGGPVVFRMGTATVLGRVRFLPDRLMVELAQVDGGGEGVLPRLWVIADRVAQRRRLPHVEWVVHAINCAQPNLKLRRVLERRGFVVEDVPGIGMAYRYLHQVQTP